MNILEYWDFKSPPRQAQIQTLKWYVENQDKKYLFCNLPVGSGKSNLPVTISNFLRNREDSPTTFILTPQKILQKQYEESFKDRTHHLFSLYGKVNYPCHSKKTNCSIGGLLNPKCESCPNKIAKVKAKESSNVVLNYNLALTLFAHTELFNRRTLMAFDECHNIEAFLTDFNSCTVTASRCASLNIQFCTKTTPGTVYDWIKGVYMVELEEVVESLTYECDDLLSSPITILSGEEQRKLTKLHNLTEHLAEIANFCSIPYSTIQKDFVLVQDEASKKFKYLYGKYNFHTYLTPYADQFLFMSATVNYEEMCENLNIPIEETAFISIDSDFPVENRPVYYLPIMKMNYQWNKDENKQGRKNLLDAIMSILQHTHLSDNGIIHTGNYQIAQWLIKELEGRVPHELYHHNPDSDAQRDDVIKLFNRTGTPSLLISPSITEGLDLIGDKSRFAIFAKVPFGSLGDAWIKKRMELSKMWYLTTALTDVLQGCGRVVRSKDDWGSVYILDESWDYLYRNTKHLIPNWWKEGLQE
jgi:ATP-dependent DNA helicase DinG